MAASAIKGIYQHLFVTTIITLAALCCTADQVCPLRPQLPGSPRPGTSAHKSGRMLRTCHLHVYASLQSPCCYLSNHVVRRGWPFQAHIRVTLGHGRQLNVDPTTGGLQTIASGAEASTLTKAATDTLATGGGAAAGAAAVGTAPGPQLPSKCPGQCTLYGTCNEELGR